MGFYGNIANTSKTTFSFDLIYSNRWAMDQMAETDGVFLGRYVLVQYDAPPIKAYYNPVDKWMYNSPTFTSVTKITTATEGQLYQNIANTNSIYGFYIFKNGKFDPIQSTADSPYALNLQTDVKEYGRGYDSTVWMKQFNPESRDYKYVMMAELNAVVPTFHLILDAPTEAPVAPYFDRDSTNIDYYLHVQPQYGVRVAKKAEDIPSDEVVTRKFITWDKAPDSGRYDWNENTEEGVAADIYYNRAGFSHSERTHEDMVANTINYNYVKSGRVYSKDPETSVWDPALEKEDTYEWYFRLPVIGNSICEMWDKVYGLPFEVNGNKRNLNEAQVANDKKEHLVTYDRSTLMGMVNTMRDMLGYYFIPYENAPVTGDDKINYENRNKTVTVTPKSANGVTWEPVEYPALKCLYYELDDQGAVTNYYHYAYSPELREFTGTPNSSTVYYYEDGRVANAAMLNSKTADDNTPTGAVEKIYYASPAWKLAKIDNTYDDSIYSILNELYAILGVNAKEVRSFDSIQGSINIMKDLLGNINLNLAPGRLVHTNVDTGVIETTNTYFPGSVADQTRVLDGTGAWVNRVKTITVGTGDSGTEAVTDIEPSENIAIEADNDNTNDIRLNSGNKWIRLASDGERDITFAHYTQTPQDAPTSIDFNDSINNIPTKESFDTQTVAWDEAGHIKSYVTTTYNLPKGYKRINVISSTEDEEPLVNDAVVVADYTIDEVTFKPGNKWINLAAVDGNKEDNNANSISYSHILQDELTEGSYGLAASETVETLDADNTFEVPYYTVDSAGHVTKSQTNTVTIPENFEKVVLEVSADNAETELEAKAGNFAPTTLVDTITFGTKNKWIRAAVDGKRIDFAHRLSPVTPTTSTQKLETSTTFDVPTYDFDSAGHLIKQDTKTITIANAFKKFTVGKKVDAVNNTVSHVEGSADPDTPTDEFTFYNGNKWIDIAMNRAGANTNVDDSMTFSHIVAHTAPISKGSTVAETPKFGATFTVPSATIDEAGHVTKLEDHTVTIPLPSMTVSETGNVVVNASMIQENGAITVSRVNVGTLNLAEYKASQETAPADVADTDTINSAFAKLQKQMNEEEAARAQAIIKIGDDIDGLINGASEGYNTFKELEDLLKQETIDIEGLEQDLNDHTEDTENPHNVTAAQVGLGNVANEDKVTMFASEEFAAAVEAILSNFTLSLSAPLYNLEHTEGSDTAKIALENQTGETSIIWYKKQVDTNEFAVAESVPSNSLEYKAESVETAGVYRCELYRTYMGHKSNTITTPEFELVYVDNTTPPEEEEPVPTE